MTNYIEWLVSTFKATFITRNGCLKDTQILYANVVGVSSPMVMAQEVMVIVSNFQMTFLFVISQHAGKMMLSSLYVIR